jgi:hypothetical protein
MDLEKTDRLTGEPFNPSPQRQMFPLDLLRVAFAQLMLIYLYMARVRAPRVRITFRDPKGLQQGFELQKYFVLATPKHIGQDLATAVIYRMPQPARCFFPPHEGPHFVDFRFFSDPYDHLHLIWI